MKSLSPKLIVLWIVFVVLGCAAKFEPANPVAFGRNWTLLGVDDQKQQHFYDNKSVIYSEKLIKFRFRSVDKLGYETLSTVELDCEKDMAQIIEAVRYDKYFRSVGPMPDFLWHYIRPDSVMGANKSRFCK